MADVLVAEVISEKVVYNGLENGVEAPTDEIHYLGAPTEAVAIADGAISIVSGALTVGMMATPPPVNAVFGVLAGVGALISAGLKFVPGEKDPLEERLKELTKQVQKLNALIIARFGGMRAFIMENKFFIEVVGEISTLKKFMDDVLIEKTPNSIENFKLCYEKNPPLNIGYILLSILSQDSTNPLIMEIEADKEQIEKTFRKWENIILTLIGDLKLLEAFASGLLKRKSAILNKIGEEKTEDGKEWKKYKDEFSKYKKMYLDEPDNEKIAKTIHEEVRRLGYEYTVAIFKSATPNKDFYIHCVDPDQLVELQIDKYTCGFVYRTKTSDSDDLEPIKTQLKDVGTKFRKRPESLNKLVDDELVAKNLVRTDGLIALINSDRHPIVYFQGQYEKNNARGEDIDLELEGGDRYAKLIVCLP
uniref:DUF4781 domain-containing protein n=1 Tax=Caenorhabditis tropicalis TaxID=1561998 RepID=A0A1I7UE58_9PELO